LHCRKGEEARTDGTNKNEVEEPTRDELGAKNDWSEKGVKLKKSEGLNDQNGKFGRWKIAFGREGIQGNLGRETVETLTITKILQDSASGDNSKGGRGKTSGKNRQSFTS